MQRESDDKDGRPAQMDLEEAYRQLAEWQRRHAGRSQVCAEDAMQEGLLSILERSPATPIHYAKRVAKNWLKQEKPILPKRCREEREALAKAVVKEQEDPDSQDSDVIAVWDRLLRATPSLLGSLPEIIAKKARHIGRTNKEDQYAYRLRGGKNIPRREFLQVAAAGLGVLFLPRAISNRRSQDPFDHQKLDLILDTFQRFRLHGPLRVIPILFDPIIENGKAWLERFAPVNDAVANTFMRLFDFRHLVAQDMMMEADFQDAILTRILDFRVLSAPREKEWRVRHLQDKCRASFHREDLSET